MQSIGRLLLSSHKIHTLNNKIYKDCIDLITGEKSIIKTKKTFDNHDSYIIYHKLYNTIENTLGYTSNESDNEDIYHHLYTNNWKGDKVYNNIEIDYEYDICTNREIYNKTVITVDPEGSLDLDDGFTIDEDNNYIYLDIHIADPTSFLFPELLWNEIMIRQSTCYIPDISNKKVIRNLLPNKLLKLCSLTNDDNKRAITFSFIINKKTLEIQYEYKNTILTNIKNYTYDQYDNTHTEICNILNTIMKRNIKINDNHDTIETFMIFTNWYVGNKLKNPIYRIQDKCDEHDNELIKYLLYKTANYSNSEKYHATLNLDGYCHLTSPMRRTVDMINHYVLREIEKEYDIEYINKITKYQRKINNTYKLIKYLELSNKFNCIIYKDYLLLESINNNKFKKIIYDYPSIINLDDYSNKKFVVELHYLSQNLKSTHPPFKIKIL